MADKPTLGRSLARSEATRLIAVCVAFCAMTVAADRVVEYLLRGTVLYRSSQDPRQRILWDSRYDGSPVVLIGDSVFCSYFVDTPGDTLWARLSSELGVSVYPAALNGATPADMVAIAKRVARLWPPGTTALIDIHPARVFAPGDMPSHSDAAYRQQFEALIEPGDQSSPWPARLDRKLLVWLADYSFSLRNSEWIQRFIDVRLKGGADYYGVGEHRDRRWDGGDDFALQRFRGLEAALASGVNGQAVPFAWVRSLVTLLRARGIRPLLILTPLNAELVRRYSTRDRSVEGTLASSHQFLLAQLAAAGFEYLDLYSSLDASDFADAIHLNGRGERTLAQRLGREIEVLKSSVPGRVPAAQVVDSHRPLICKTRPRPPSRS